ncbi:unnamed protein product [Allacma fusca]|uniref:Uncharacterized protein n=1 Tax=Allacma fusca TaxID=39272 RepID=A0A8J2JYX0_9HEXA|nr:unnamed protein product [Allacma fusca]
MANDLLESTTGYFQYRGCVDHNLWGGRDNREEMDNGVTGRAQFASQILVFAQINRNIKPEAIFNLGSSKFSLPTICQSGPDQISRFLMVNRGVLQTWTRPDFLDPLVPPAPKDHRFKLQHLAHSSSFQCT